MPRDAWGHEQRGARYAVVVQATNLELSTVLVAPTSTAARPTSFRPEIVVEGVPTRVLVEQVGVVDPDRLGEPAGVLTTDERESIDRALTLVLGLSN